MRKDLIDEVISSPKVNTQLDNLEGRLKKIVGLMDVINTKGRQMSFAQGLSESVKAAQEARAAMEELRKEREALRKQEQELRNAMAAVNVEISKQRLERAKLTTEEAKARAAKRQAKQDLQGEKGSIVDLTRTLRDLRAQYDLLGPAARKAFGGQKLLTDIKAVDAELKKLKGNTGRFQDNVGNYPKFVGGVGGFLGAFGVATGGAVIAKQVFDTTVQLDSLNAALKAVSGSDAEFAKNQQFLVETSERLGLNILDLTQSYKLFYAASTQSGLSADTTRSIFNSVAESAAVLKLSTEDTQGVLLAFSQILGKGKVQAEELRGQIGERIPGAFAIAARSIGKTEQELNKMLEKGEVIAADFLPKFAKELEKTFGTEEKVEGLQASINRLSNTFTKLISDNESGLARFFSLVINGATKSLEALNGLTTGFSFLINKVFDPQAADQMATDGAFKKLRETYGKEDVGKLLERRNQTDKLLEQESERLDRMKVSADALRQSMQKGFATAQQYYSALLGVDDQQKQVDQLTRNRDLLVDVLKGKVPGGGDAPVAKTTTLTKEQESAAARLRERTRKALLDSKNIDLQTAMDSQKELFENEKANLQDRLDALANYFDLREQQINENLEDEKKKEKLLPAEIQLLEDKADSDRIKNKKDFWKNVTDVTKSGADETTKDILKAQEEQTATLSAAEDEELKKVTELLKEKAITEEQFELLSLQIKNKYANLQLQVEIENARKILEVKKNAGQPVSEEVKRLNDLINQLRDADLQYYEDSEKKKTDALQKQLDARRELEQQYNDRIKTLRQDAVNLATEIGTGFFEKEKNRVQEQIDLLDKQKEKDIETANNSIQNAQDREAAISAINQSAQVKKEALERRQREIDQRAALFQKFMSLLQIGITTAETVFKIQAQAAVLSSNPITAALAANAYAQIPLVIASGLLQAAAIASKPIPKYFMGTEDHPGGLAEVGDGYRHEVLVNPDGSIGITPNRPTLMNLEEHTKVIPSLDEFFRSNPWMFFPDLDQLGGQAINDEALAKRIVDGVDKSMRRVENAIVNRPSERTIITEAGMQKQIYKHQKWQTYINRVTGNM